MGREMEVGFEGREEAESRSQRGSQVRCKSQMRSEEMSEICQDMLETSAFTALSAGSRTS